MNKYIYRYHNACVVQHALGDNEYYCTPILSCQSSLHRLRVSTSKTDEPLKTTRACLQNRYNDVIINFPNLLKSKIYTYKLNAIF